MKQKIKNILGKMNINNLKKEIRFNFNNSVLVWCFVISCLINATFLRFVTVKNYFDIKPFLIDLGFLLLVGLVAFCFSTKKKKFTYLIIWSIILTAICTINSLYFTYYSSYASVSLLATSIFVVDVGDAINENVVQYKDFIFLWQPIFMFYIYYRLRKQINAESKNDRKKIVKQFSYLAVSILALCAIFTTPTEWGRFTKLWNRESVVLSFGIYTYQFNDVVQSLQPKLNNIFGHDNAYKVVTDYYNENKYTEQKNDYTGIFKGKNIIFIHAESMQAFTMDLTINGTEMTPNLNRLASEGMNFSNFYSEVGVGTSSDTEFTLNTSLMPTLNGTVFVNYFDREYITIPKLLKEKGYYTFSMHGNSADFWNRNVMHKNMGYDNFYSKEYYNIDETIGLGLSDKSFFRQTVPIIKEISETNQPFMATTIMLTNHTPFSDLDLMDEYPTTWTVNINGEEVTRNYLQGTVLGNYFRSVHYADQAIGEFIQELDDAGLLDNTVIVIYGDHDARIEQKYYDIFYNYDPYTDTILTEDADGYVKQNQYTYELNRRVPFIIWTKNQQYNVNVDTPMGMIDVLPTLGNMFGFHSEYQLGNDIFNLKDNTVVFTNGSYLTNKIYYNSQKSEIYSINGDAVDEDYIQSRSAKADKIIEVSNDIISFDLIKEIRQKKNLLNK